MHIMGKLAALAKILETYTDVEIRNAKDEPDTAVNDTRTRSATVVTLYGGREHAARATHRKVKQAFHAAGHGKRPADALANARRVLGLAEAA
jgi:hypothetical protein